MNPQQTNVIRATPKDFFFHLAATVALYSAATALIDLCFSIINYLAPDKLAGSFYASSVAWPISTLVILIPILYVMEWLIFKDIVAVPEKKDIWIRRWRIYLTLFLTVALISGDLIVLINTYLNGEVTARFVYKIITILVISGGVFKYYFFSLNEGYKYSKLIRRGNAIFMVVLTVAAIVTGFILVGSPTKQRNIRFDNQRINDLQGIQWQIVSYWQNKSKLPQSTDDITDSISGYRVPVDPETGAEYTYTIKNDKSFTLCANFTLETQDVESRGVYGNKYAIDYAYPTASQDEVWTHSKGKVCFDRTIDPDKYPPIKK